MVSFSPFRTCVHAVEPNTCVEEPVLGDSFLRAAYVVYDQDNRNLHLAQAANCGTELVAIGKGADAVPSIAGGCGPETSSSTTAPGSTTPPSTSPTGPKTTTTPDSQLTSFSSYPNATTPTTITSTITSSTIYTITSCPPTVTQCPYGQVTTVAVTLTTTYCPESSDSYTLTGEPATSLGISAPCLNCDIPSSSSPPATTGTGRLPATTATSKPTSVVTAGADSGLNVGRWFFSVVMVAAAAAML